MCLKKVIEAITATYVISIQTDFSGIPVGNEALVPIFIMYTWPLGCQTHAHLFGWLVAYCEVGWPLVL